MEVKYNMYHQKYENSRPMPNDSESKFSKLILVMSSLTIVLLLSIASCTKNQECDELLVKVDSLMNIAPDSALTILDSIEPFSKDLSRSSLRRWQLLRLMAQNKCDTIFRSDSLQLVLTEYYDHHGTHNERMQAHYLLGRAYADMGDAPQALRCYQEAADCADTTSHRCDWRQLSLVHIQAGILFYKQYLPNEALESFAIAERMARRCGDMQLCINSSELTIPAYYELSDFSKIDSLTDLAHQGYDEMGETEMASRALATSLYYHVKVGDTVKARKQIDYLLSHVGREKMISSSEWLSFNASIGNFYLLIDETDSAETHFRTMLTNDNHLQTKVYAYHGLMDVYQRKGNSDSVYKYTNAYCYANDSSNIFRYAEQLEKINSLYRYDRMERNMLLSEASSRRKTFIMATIILISVVLLLSAYLFFRHKQMLSKRELMSQATRYNDLREEYQSLSKDLDEMKTEKFDLTSALAEKERQLAILGKRIEEYDVGIHRLSPDDPETSEIFKDLHKKASKGEKATFSELQSMRAVLSEKASGFVRRLMEMDYKMGAKEENICYMLCYGFSESEISILLGMSPQSLSSRKRKLLKKLFHTDGKASDLYDYLCKLQDEKE